MKHTLLGATMLFAALGAGTANAQISLVNPVPQQVVKAKKGIVKAPTTWKIVSDKQRSGCIAADALVASKLVKNNPAARFTVTIGVKGDKAVSKVAKHAPSHAEGYYMEVSEKGVTIVGSDETGLYYGAVSYTHLTLPTN